MKQIWIEDFIAIVEYGSFSRAAKARFVTQPALSRRVRALEEWLGVDLIDRSKQPVQLTKIAKNNIHKFQNLLHHMEHLRNSLAQEREGTIKLLIVTQHALTLTHLPGLLHTIKGQSNLAVNFNSRSEHRDVSISLFLQTRADLLLCNEQKHNLLENNIPGIERVQLGFDKVIAVCASDSQGQPLYPLNSKKIIKLIGFPKNSYMAEVVNDEVSELIAQHNVVIVHESVFAAGVKEMVKKGQGMAWLPYSLVKSELTQGTLIDLSNELPFVEIEVSLYRHIDSENASKTEQVFSILKNTRLPGTQTIRGDLGWG